MIKLNEEKRAISRKSLPDIFVQPEKESRNRSNSLPNSVGLVDGVKVKQLMKREVSTKSGRVLQFLLKYGLKEYLSIRDYESCLVVCKEWKKWIGISKEDNTYNRVLHNINLLRSSILIKILNIYDRDKISHLIKANKIIKYDDLVRKIQEFLGSYYFKKIEYKEFREKLTNQIEAISDLLRDRDFRDIRLWELRETSILGRSLGELEKLEIFNLKLNEQLNNNWYRTKGLMFYTRKPFYCSLVIIVLCIITICKAYMICTAMNPCID